LLRHSGLLPRLEGALAPLFSLAGIGPQAVPCSLIGLFLGTTYGGGMILHEAKAANIAPRQVFIACIFMGFAHGIIEDTLLVVALGADLTSVLVARLIFSAIASALIALAVNRTSDAFFFTALFKRSP
jgi:spore maturation protein SpmB